MCKIAGKNYYSRKHMDALFGISAEIEALTEWLTTDEAETLYSTTKESLRTQALPPPYSHQARIWQDLLFKETS